MKSLKKVADVVRVNGDGISHEVLPDGLLVIDTLLEKFGKRIEWVPVDAGDIAVAKTGKRLPSYVIDAIKYHGLAIKGPLTTAKGERSSNVFLRKELDLFSCVRPCKFYPGMDSPLKHPEGIDIVIFRENLEDLYVGIEFFRDSIDTASFAEYINNMQFGRGQDNNLVPTNAGIAVKYITEEASRDIMNAGIEYALAHGYESVTVVAKYNVMQATELLFEESCRAAFDEHPIASQKLTYKKLITDNAFQQIISNPQEYGVIVTPNVSGDYLSDAVASVIGGKFGIGYLPGANIGKKYAVFEAVHGSWPDAAGKGIASPIGIIQSGRMLLDHIGLHEESTLLESYIASTIKFMDETRKDGIILGTKAITTNLLEQIERKSAMFVK